MDVSTLIFIALLGLLGYYVFATRNAIKAGQKKLHAQRSKKQSVEVGSPETVKIGDVVLNSTAPRRHEKAAKGMLTGWDDKITTLVQMFDYTVSKGADLPCLGSRPIVAGKAGPFEFQTYKQISIRRDNLASGLKALTGLKFGDCIGIYSINRPEWVITDLACHKFGFPSISLYDTLGANAVEYIVNHAEIKTCVCAGKQLDIMLTVAKSSKSLKYLISMDPLTEKQRDAARVANVSVWEFTEVEKQGVASPQQPDRVVKPNDVYTIMYTSGTTGNPKGVVHTNANYIAEVAGIREHQEGLFAASDVHLSYLPLAHSFERIVYMTMMSYGAQVGFFQGNLQELFNDIAELRPTFLVGAPRVWQRLQEKLLSTIAASPFIRRTLFQIGFNQKKEALKNGMSTPIWDKILFSKTKARLGGRVGWILTGSAPLDPALGEFLKVCFCCPILEGYGLTENAAGACATFLDETQLGHVGPPFPCCEVKLVDVPEMNYSAKANPPKGEIWIRGPNIFREYLKEPKKTEEVLFADGWFATGDIGRFNENGSLSIIDRKKNIFKLMQGEYVAVEFLEGVFKRSQFVGQIWVYGSSFKRFLISVVVPNWDFVIPWAKSQGISDLSEDGLAANPKLKQAILDDLTKTGKAAQIQPFEHVKAVHIFAKPFSVDNDLTTPTFKLKRPQLKEYFTKQIDEMYKAIGE